MKDSNTTPSSREAGFSSVTLAGGSGSVEGVEIQGQKMQINVLCPVVVQILQMTCWRGSDSSAMRRRWLVGR